MRLPRLPRIPLFRIFYSTTFTLLTLLLTALLLITPGDHIYQSFGDGQLYHIVVVAAVYLLTFIVAVFIYAARLFGTRSALAGIPQEWSLSGGGSRNPGIGLGMGYRIGKVVREGLERSAIISYEGTPRDVRAESNEKLIPSRKRKREQIDVGDNEGPSIVESKDEPIWGTISHPGWSSPESPDFPSLHFEPVIAELGHLIEAKAVSLAPADPLWEAEAEKRGEDDEEQTPAPDPVAVELLQRPLAMGLRSYVSHLTSLGIITPAHLGLDFISLYEKARFSGEELSEEEFRILMTFFADILQNMQFIDHNIVENVRAVTEAESLLQLQQQQTEPNGTRDDSDSLDSNATIRHTPQPQQAYNSASPSISSNSDTHTPVHIASPRPHASRNVSDVSKASRSIGASIRQYERNASLSSLKRTVSQASSSVRSSASSARSVIRHAEAQTALDLPYIFVDASQEALR